MAYKLHKVIVGLCCQLVILLPVCGQKQSQQHWTDLLTKPTARDVFGFIAWLDDFGRRFWIKGSPWLTLPSNWPHTSTNSFDKRSFIRSCLVLDVCKVFLYSRISNIHVCVLFLEMSHPDLLKISKLPVQCNAGLLYGFLQCWFPESHYYVA